MEGQLLVTGCLACGAGAFVLMAPSGWVPRRLDASHGWRSRAVRTLERLGRSAPMSALAQWGQWRDVAVDLVAKVPWFDEGLSAEAACTALLAGAACVAACLWWLSSSLLGLVVGVAIAPVAVVLRASSLTRARDARLMREMPDVLRSLATALGAGCSLSQAIEYVATHEEGAIGREFGRAALELRCGGSVQEALEGLGQRLDAPGVELMACALLISQRTGSPLRSLFARSAGLVEDQVALRSLLATKTAQVRLSVRVVCAMPVIMVTVLSLISPEFRAGVTSPVGAMCVCVAALLDLVAMVIVRRLMRGVLG